MSNDKVRTTSAPPPIKPLGGNTFRQYGVTTRAAAIPKTPDWREWGHMPKVEVWQACALSLNIDPHSLTKCQDWESDTRDGYPYFRDASFPSKTISKEFYLRRRVLIANLPNNPEWFTYKSLSTAGSSPLSTSEFAAWAVSKMQWPDIPPELKAMARKPGEQAVAPAPQNDVPLTPAKVGDGDTAAHGDAVLSQQPHSKGAKWTDDELQNLLRDHNAGKSQEDLASFHGVKRQCISKVLQRANANFAPKRAADISMVAQAKRTVTFGNDR
jgi:hypothetical protein